MQPTLSLRGKRRILQSLNALHDWAETYDELATPSAIHRAVGEWLMAYAFAGHRQLPPQRTIRYEGGSMPGITTPAAGWLLPQSGTATKQGSTINIAHETFCLTHSSQITDRQYPYRTMPLFLPSDEVTRTFPVFLEETTYDVTRLHTAIKDDM